MFATIDFQYQKSSEVKSKNEIKNWYNKYTGRQKKIGVNLRHFTVMNNGVKAGLQRNHYVLEVGCGIGTLTGLLAKYLKTGKLVATDISDKSIEIAKKRLLRHRNISFLVTDMQDFNQEEVFDFIILPDVLEHIPMNEHKVLFQNLSKSLKSGGKMLINTPHPKSIHYYRKNYPAKLQIIDQALPADFLLSNAYLAGLTLVHYTSYSIFHKAHDYVSILFEKNNLKDYSNKSKLEIVFSKLKLRFKY